MKEDLSSILGLIFLIIVGVIIYKSRKKNLERYEEYKKKNAPIKKVEDKISYTFELTNIDFHVAKKFDDSIDYDFISVEPYNDNKNYKVIINDDFILGDIKDSDIDIIKKNNINHFNFINYEKTLNNLGKFEYKASATAEIKKEEN